MMELDQTLINQFVEEVKADLADASELILLPCGTARAWTASYMLCPADMDPLERDAYIDAVSKELVAQGVLKADYRSHQGMPARSPGRMRVSKGWWRKAHAYSDR
jgi:hypothetical protein